jgi:hypothetical protein
VFSAYTREFVFISGRDAHTDAATLHRSETGATGGDILVVVDRVTMPRGKSVPTWVINLPSRPTLDGEDPARSSQLAGKSDKAGIWRNDVAQWVRWTERDGALWLRSLLPQPRVLRVVGGPAERMVVKTGRHADRTYVGGSPDGFERLIIPAERPGAKNAWYQLGTPTLLGPEVGRVPQWGRIEIEPTAPATSATFIHALYISAATATEPPEITFEQKDDAYFIRIAPKAEGGRPALLRLPALAVGGGTVESTDVTPGGWTLPTSVQADKPLATRDPGSGVRDPGQRSPAQSDQARTPDPGPQTSFP